MYRPCALILTGGETETGGIQRAHRDIRRAQDEQEERTAAAPDEHAESAAAGGGTTSQSAAPNRARITSADSFMRLSARRSAMIRYLLVANINHGQDTRANRTRHTTSSSTQSHAKQQHTNATQTHPLTISSVSCGSGWSVPCVSIQLPFRIFTSNNLGQSVSQFIFTVPPRGRCRHHEAYTVERNHLRYQSLPDAPDLSGKAAVKSSQT